MRLPASHPVRQAARSFPIPEGAGHVVLPAVSILALACIDWRLTLASLAVFPLSLVCMG